MERDQRRHQQPVGQGRHAGSLLVLACLVVAVAAAVWGLSAAHRHGSEGTEVPAAAAHQDDAPHNDAAAHDDAAPADDAPVTAQTFLQSLDMQVGVEPETPRDSAIAARLAWSEDRPMTEAAADMLRAYREIPAAHLAMSGYIDIKGDLWGAIVRDDRGWVDMLTVAANEGDASCRLRAVRLVPQKTILKEGT